MNVLSPASQQAQVLGEVAWTVIVGAAVVFTLTMASVAMALHRRRRTVPLLWWLVGGGIVFPGVVLAVLLDYATWRTRQVDTVMPRDALVVSVTAHMWWWEVRYLDPATGRQVTLANELRLPLGRATRIALTSHDVIHAFWVPELGGKMDMLPGRTDALLVTATHEGVYRGQCAEFCGEQHARMALHVVVQSPASFGAWLAQQSADAAAASTPELARGRDAFVSQGCAACHTVRGISQASDIGPRAPDLTHVGSRLHLGAGVLRNHRGAMAAWVPGVQALKPGAHMPAVQQMDADTLTALSAYLESLQ
jgi:cytochrome c oxidase subunit II